MIVVLITIATLLVCIYAYVVRNNDFWKKRNVPFDKPKFLFGNVLDIFWGTKHYGELYAEMYRKHQDCAYAGYFYMRSPAVVARDPELIKNVLVKDFDHFSFFDSHVKPDIDEILSANIFTQKGEEWKKNRTAWGSTMTSSKVKAMYESIYENCNVMIDFLKNHIKNHPDEPLDAKDLSLNFFTDNIVRNILGLEINSFEDKDNPFKTVVIEIFNSLTFLDNILIGLPYIIPTCLNKILKIKFVPRSTEKKLLKMADDVLKNREQTGFQKNNALDILINSDLKNHQSLKTRVAGIILSLLMDGTETSSTVSSFMLYSLAANPEIQSKLRDEITNAAGDGKLTYDEIHSLPYLDMVVSETMRLYPTVLTMERTCTKPYTLPPAYPGGVPVKLDLGAVVSIPVYGLHMDPKYFPEPEKFDPERFNQENKRSMNKFTYLPFGEGPRICIGTRFALNQIKIGIVEILKNFEIQLAPNMKDKPIAVDVNSVIFKNVNGLWITLRDIKD